MKRDEQRQLANELMENSPYWQDFILPMLEESRTLAVNSAINSLNMEELCRNQGWVACVDDMIYNILELSTEYKEQNPDD